MHVARYRHVAKGIATWHAPIGFTDTPDMVGVGEPKSKG